MRMANQSQPPLETYSTQSISDTLVEEIRQALKNVSPYGSVEIYVQDNVVTQITVRNIKKTTSISKPKVAPRIAPNLNGARLAY
jgi:hypothetical protein